MNVYDFDNTIYDGDSSVDFYLFVLSRKPYLVIFLPFQIWSMALFMTGIYSKERMKEAFFIFIRYISVNEMVSQFWKRNCKKIKSWYLQQKLDSDLVISASPGFLLEPFVCNNLGIALIASKIDVNTGRYIGKNCYGEEKIVRLYNTYSDSVIEKFYSDSLSDTPLAQKAMQSYIVKGQDITPWGDYNITLFEKIKNTYFSKDFILFIFCGGMGTLTNFIFSLVISLILNPSVSYVFGYGIGTFVTYSFNTKLVIYQKISCVGFFKFVTSYIPNFVILFTFVYIFINLLHWNKVIVYAMAAMLGLPITFLLVKLMFSNKGKK